MTIEELKKKLQENKDFLKSLGSCGNSLLVKKARKQAKENIKNIKFMIWKKENPQSFENHKKAFENFIKSGVFSSVMTN